jgi:hypothetical protein
MKKIIALLATCAILLTVCGCEPPEPEPPTTTATTTADTTTATETTTTEATTESQPTANEVSFDWDTVSSFRRTAHDMPTLFADANYYREDDSGEYIRFGSDGNFMLNNSEDDIIEGEWAIDSDGDIELTLLHDGSREWRKIHNAARIADSDGVFFSLDGANNERVVYSERYYLNGDNTSLALWFNEDGTMDVEIPDEGDAAFVWKYDRDGDILILFEDDEVRIIVENTYILTIGDHCFLRIPE